MAEENPSDRPAEPPEDDAPTDQPQQDPVGDVLIGSILALVSLFVVVESVRMPIRGPLGLATSPGFVPLLLGGASLVLCLVLVAVNMRRGGHRGVGAWLAAVGRQEESTRLLVLIVLLSAYVLALGWIPFTVATFLFLVVTFAYLRAAAWWLNPIIAALAAGLVAWLLPLLFEMPVP